MVYLDSVKLEQWCGRCFAICGVRPDDAAVAAAVLTRATLRGSDTHGVHLLPSYTGKLRSGGANPLARNEILSETPATAHIDGDRGLGAIVMTRATSMAIAKARSSGVAAVLVRNSTHFGAAGSYALMCAEAGLIATVSTNGSLTINVPGSRGANLSSGTRAFGVPNDGPPIVLDISMAPSGAKIQMAIDRGEGIPEGWLVDAAGRPTTDPAEYLRGGARVPIGEHKGYGMALVNELISGALTGADLAWSLGPTTWLDPSRPQNVGHAVVALDVAAFMPLPAYLVRVREVIDRIKSSPPDGVGAIRIPGERSAETESRRRSDGIPVDEVEWQSLYRAATALGTTDELIAARKHEDPIGRRSNETKL